MLQVANKLELCTGVTLPLTSSAGFSPAGGDTAGAGVEVEGGQAHRGHPVCHLDWGGQLQQGDVVVVLPGVVVGVSDNLQGTLNGCQYREVDINSLH